MPELLTNKINRMNYQKLFDYMNQEHGVTLLESDMQEIRNIVLEAPKQGQTLPLDSVSVSSSIKNIPDKIYLQIGESDVTEDQSITDWNELFHGAITWADERINESDIEYSR